MSSDWYETFLDKDFWDKKVDEYIKTGSASGKTPTSYIGDLWYYFKYCLITQNRFFFEHPLLDTIKIKISENETTLKQNTTIFRARIDKNNYYSSLAQTKNSVCRYKELIEKAETSEGGKEFLTDKISSLSKTIGFTEYLAQNNLGFEGFDKDGSGAPPTFLATAGRCNPTNVAFLYASNDIHTAVAEVRPYITETVSVASLSTKEDLRLVDFNYDISEDLPIDWLFNSICLDFSNINKGNENEYFSTQYLTLLVKQMGYDGIQFGSSLSLNGLNYVIFDSQKCDCLSSKLYSIQQVKYGLMPITRGTHLKDSHKNEIPDPSF